MYAGIPGGKARTTFQATDLCDEFAAELAVCQLELRSFGGRRRFSGPIATLRVYEDNVPVRQLA